MTKEERHLWYDFLKGLPLTVYRQKVFGNYILDFYCAKAGIAIELDGSQHVSDIGIYKDTVRDTFLRQNGITVLRYSNRDIHDQFDRVCADIWHHLTPFLPSLPLEGKVSSECETDEV